MQVIYVRDSKSRGYLRIGVGDGEAKSEFHLSKLEYTELGSPVIGDELWDIERLKEFDMRYRGKLYALRILAYGDNNRKTLIRKLILKSIPVRIATEIADEMIGLGYVNEEKQLERLIVNEVNVKLSGREKVVMKLIAKGYGRKKIEEITERLISERMIDFEDSKKRLIEKKLSQDASEAEIKALLYKYGY